MANTKIEITIAKMSDEMQRDALQCSLLAVNMYDKRSDIATYIAKEFDRKYQPYWYCIVGNFSSFVRHKEGCYIYFSVGDKSIMLFKSV